MASWVLVLGWFAAAQPDPRVLEHVRAGLAARDANRLEDAARELGAAARLAPHIAEIYLNLGLVQHRSKDWKAAIASFEHALKLKPDMRGVRDLLGFDYLMLGNLDRAIESLQTALQESPANDDAHFWLGLAYLEAADYRRAIAELEQARTSRPKDPDLLFYLARAYERASAELRQELLLTAPDSLRAHMAAAEFAAFNGRTAEAIQEYEKVLARDPGMPGVHAAIAELHAQSGDYVKAEQSYRRELALAPQNARSNYRYGLVLLQLSRLDDAIRHLQIAVDADPDLIDARLHLGKALLQAGRLEPAESALLHVVQEEGSSELKSTAHYQLGLLYRKRGQTEKAAHHIRLFEQLRSPNKP